MPGFAAPCGSPFPEAVGRLRLSVPRTAVPFVIDPVLPTFRARHPRVVRGGVLTNDHMVAASLAERGMGLAYAFEPAVTAELRAGRLQRALEQYAATVPGYFLYFPSRAQQSAPLRLFVEAARELSVRSVR